MVMFGKHLRRNKKGSLIDIMFIGVVLMFFGIVVLVGLNIAGQFQEKINENPMFNDGESRNAVGNVIVKYTNTIDNTFLFLTIFLALGTLVLASLVIIHPMFIPFFFIGWVLVIYFSGILSNIYQAIAADSNMLAIAGELTFITHILTALPIITGIFGILLMVVMYKIRSNSLQ